MKDKIEHYFDRLWPICRSLTGDGNRESFKILQEITDIKLREIPSGTRCFDWTVPPEWNIKKGFIKDSKGNVIVDFEINNLHILGYSEPVSLIVDYDTLKDHIYTLPEQPNLIPYLTSYYQRRWGFCMTHNQFNDLDKNDNYQVMIESDLNDEGSMTMGEVFISGESEKEILFSTYICHPSLANNELSGPLVTSFICQYLKNKKHLKYSYRFAFVPETIGSICLLSEKGDHFKKNLQGGFVITCIGDSGDYTYKRSRIGNALPDRAAELILEQTEVKFNLVEFFPGGSDERQYCSPGFNLPVGSLMKTMYGKYPEYHTSADNKDFISFEAMEAAVNKYLEIIELIERNEKFINLLPNCEPQLGKRGLYPTLGSQKMTDNFVEGMMWILNLADGEHDLIDMSRRSEIKVQDLYPIIDKLLENKILKKQ